MTNEITLAMRFAEAVAVWHWAVAFYLVFIAERLTPFRALVAFVKAALGTGVYLLVRRPQWAIEANLYEMGFLVPLTVFLVLLVSVIMTILIWRAEDLQPPHERIREILRNW